MSLQQVLAPQLQQSLALLQAPTLELKAMVEQELQQNPVLEEVQVEEIEQKEKPPREDDTTPGTPEGSEEPGPDPSFDTTILEKPTPEPVDEFQAEFDRLTQLDQEWRDHFAETKGNNGEVVTTQPEGRGPDCSKRPKTGRSGPSAWTPTRG